MRIHGITEDMARDKPPARIVLPQFKNFVGDGVLVAWNAAFDMRFLELKQDEAGVRFDNPVLDALLLSIYVSDDPINHSLMATAERLGVVVTGRHTALGDAMATAAIWVSCWTCWRRAAYEPWVRPSGFRAVWSLSAGSSRSSDRCRDGHLRATIAVRKTEE